jgi:hypothetical protein
MIRSPGNGNDNVDDALRLREEEEIEVRRKAAVND